MFDDGLTIKNKPHFTSTDIYIDYYCPRCDEMDVSTYNFFIRCEDCHGKMYVAPYILTTYPPQHEYKCDKCGKVKTVFIE